ncbi:MAG: hypothetical protein NTZ38_02580 [Candidatus Taylorbacteria bacterium]|nr:hypothetical protein [Candidatus Taylorbacteria bacterium]
MKNIRAIFGVAISIIFLIGAAMILVTSPANIQTSIVTQTPDSGSVLIATKSSASNQISALASTTQPANKTPNGYTMAQIKAHATASNCWTAVNGKVYDVTPWINQHPGGTRAIISMCGIDGSSAFNGQHGGQRRPASELASFVIGSLVQ